MPFKLMQKGQNPVPRPFLIHFSYPKDMCLDLYAVSVCKDHGRGTVCRYRSANIDLGFRPGAFLQAVLSQRLPRRSDAQQKCLLFQGVPACRSCKRPLVLHGGEFIGAGEHAVWHKARRCPEVAGLPCRRRES